jgi:hypothetical protein
MVLSIASPGHFSTVHYWNASEFTSQLNESSERKR